MISKKSNIDLFCQCVRNTTLSLVHPSQVHDVYGKKSLIASNRDQHDMIHNFPRKLNILYF